MKVTKDIHELILSYLREDISEEEMSRLRVWLDENERHQRLLEELIRMFCNGRSGSMCRLTRPGGGDS